MTNIDLTKEELMELINLTNGTHRWGPKYEKIRHSIYIKSMRAYYSHSGKSKMR